MKTAINRKMFRRIIFCCLVICLIVGYLQIQAQAQHAPLPTTKNGFVVISHRGNHVKVPENTVASIKEAINAGADYAEIDLRTTKDGFLVLSHDVTVDRMTNGKGNVKDLTLEEIKKLEIVEHADKQDKKIYHIPEFKEILEVSKQHINIYLDFKDADPVEAYQQIKDAGMEKNVVVYLNKREDYSKWKKVAPAMPLMASVPHEIKTAAQLGFFLSVAQLEVLDNITDSSMLALAKQKGIAVWLDCESADEAPAIWDQALSKAIQGIQTDHPENLVAYLKKTGQRDHTKASVKNESTTGYSLPPYRKLSDISYGDDKENKMDAYLPSDYEGARVIVYIHGGGWTGGDKNEFPSPMIEELVGRRGYIVVSMNYRLVHDGQNHFPAQIEDVSRLLSFINKNSRKYHYRDHEFVLMGGSAGAHLAMLYAYGYDSAKQVKAVVDFWGPSDLSDKAVRSENKDADSKVVNLLGVTDPQDPLCIAASPLLRITKESGVPTILFHGAEDPLVNVSQAEKMYQKLLSLGIPAQLQIYPHEKHGLGADAAIDAFGKTLTWLEKYYPAK